MCRIVLSKGLRLGWLTLDNLDNWEKRKRKEKINKFLVMKYMQVIIV